jgi:hypothetical protein
VAVGTGSVHLVYKLVLGSCCEGGFGSERGVAVGEDEEVVGGQEVEEWVHVVTLIGDRVFEEVESEGAFAGWSPGHELVGVGVGSADDDLALPVGEELVGRLPTARRERLGGGLHPVVGAVCSARRQAADLALAFAVAARLH